MYKFPLIIMAILPTFLSCSSQQASTHISVQQVPDKPTIKYINSQEVQNNSFYRSQKFDFQSQDVTSLELVNTGTHSVQTPRILFDSAPDTFEMEQFLNDATSSGGVLSNEQAAIRIWEAYSNRLQHYCSAGNGSVSETDPLYLLGNFGFGCCDQIARGLSVLFSAYGLSSQIVAFPSHTVTEIYYEGAWHMFDADHKVFYRDPTGVVADTVYLKNHPEIIAYDADEASIEQMKTIYTTETSISFPFNISMDRLHYGVDFALYPGEKIIYRILPERISSPSFIQNSSSPIHNSLLFIEAELEQRFQLSQNRFRLHKTKSETEIHVPISLPYVAVAGDIKILGHNLNFEGYDIAINTEDGRTLSLEATSDSVRIDSLVSTLKPGRQFDLVVTFSDISFDDTSRIVEIQASWLSNASPFLLSLSNLTSSHSFEYVDNNFDHQRDVGVILNGTESFAISDGVIKTEPVQFRPLYFSFDLDDTSSLQRNVELASDDAFSTKYGIDLPPFGQGMVRIKVQRRSGEFVRILPLLGITDVVTRVSYDQGASYYLINGDWSFNLPQPFHEATYLPNPIDDRNAELWLEFEGVNHSSLEVMLIDRLLLEIGPH